VVMIVMDEDLLLKNTIEFARLHDKRHGGT
jgi:hypothetical protein